MPTRVPTTASYNLYMRNIATQKNSANQYSYQSITGNRYETYDQYGVSTYRLLSLENEQAKAEKFLDTNKVTQVVIETQESAITSIRDAMINFRSDLRNFYSNDLENLSKNPTSEGMTALASIQESAFEAMSLLAYYLNTEADGTYVFGGGEANVKPVDFNYKCLEEYQADYDGKMNVYPMSYSAVMTKMYSDYTQTGGLTISRDYQTVNPHEWQMFGSVQNSFHADKDTKVLSAVYEHTFDNLKPGDVVTIDTDTTNPGSEKCIDYTVVSVSEDGKSVEFDRTFLFDIDNPDSDNISITRKAMWNFTSEDNSLKGAVGEFSNLKEGQKLFIENTNFNNKYYTVEKISSDGSTVYFKEDVVPEQRELPTREQLEQFPNLKIPTLKQSVESGRLTAKTGNFITSEMVGSELQTGTVWFEANENTMTATAKGAFSSYKPGDTIMVTGSTEGKNDGAYIVKSVSSDGRTVTFDESTKLKEDQDLNNGRAVVNGEGLVLGKTYPVGTTISLTNTTNPYNTNYTIIDVPKIDENGNWYLKVNNDTFPEYDKASYFEKARIDTYSYYNGEYLETTYRISEASVVKNDINASADAFQKMFSAVGSIAQGNLLDSENITSATQRVEKALDMLEEALNANKGTSNKQSLTTIEYSLITKLDRVKTTIDSQTELNNSLTTYLDNMTQVDKTEAATYLLQAENNLNVAYKVLASINNLSLLDYI
ncbi:MAG: hypothetical protein MJ247_06475 [Alphaproteobacteria bacterium]|nr:hypothetical protein [Alphaproteobacteria bacterium]